MTEWRAGLDDPAPSGLDLPAWSVASDARRAHIARVTTLLEHWAQEMNLAPMVARAWRDAGRWHDALRDAPEADLRAILGDVGEVPALLHGPATAHRLRQEGEQRADVLEAITYHTTGLAGWGRTGRALYMADFLEPGRSFAGPERDALRARVPRDFEGAFRDVVKARVDWATRHGKELHPRTIALLESLG